MVDMAFSRRKLLGASFGALVASTPAIGSAFALTVGRSPSAVLEQDELNENIVPIGLNVGRAQLPSPRRRVYVNNNSQLRSALSSARSGDHIILRSGNYSSFTVSKNGSSGQPLVIRADRAMGARISGNVTVTGDYPILYGLDFVGGTCVLEGGSTEPRIWRCRFRDRSPSSAIALRVNRARNADIAYCEWRNWGGRGVSLGVRSGARGATIRRCLFADQPYNRNNAREAIQLGFGTQDARINSGARVEQCRFVNWSNDTECISVKTSNARVRQCVLQNCRGMVNNRFGQNNTFEAIWIRNGYGISLSDGNNRVLGCKIENSSRMNDIFHHMRASAGNQPAGRYPSNVSSGQIHNAAENCVFAGNEATSNLTIGRQRSDFRYPARNTRVRQHKGRVAYGRHSGTDNRPNSRESRHSWTGRIWLNDNNVGPFANGGTSSAPSQSTSASKSSNDNSSSSSNSRTSNASSNNSGNSSLSTCSGDPQRILNQHRGENSWDVSRRYRDMSHQHYHSARKFPSGSSEYYQHRIAYNKCNEVHTLADNLARRGIRRIP